MSVCEGGIDLNGASVALKCALNVMHFLQGVAHVGVGIGESRLDPNLKKKSGLILDIKDALSKVFLDIFNQRRSKVSCRLPMQLGSFAEKPPASDS